MRKSVKTDKRDFVEGLAEEAEKAAASRNTKQLYDTTKKLAGKFKKSERPIRDKNGTVLTGVDQQLNYLNRWAEHCLNAISTTRWQYRLSAARAVDNALRCS